MYLKYILCSYGAHSILLYQKTDLFGFLSSSSGSSTMRRCDFYWIVDLCGQTAFNFLSAPAHTEKASSALQPITEYLVGSVFDRALVGKF